MKIKNKIGVSLLTAMLCVGMFSTTAFAYVDESAVTEKEIVTETKTDTEKEEKETEKTGNALTPEGNLTLVDDEGVSSDTGKQFVTLVTKSGNYFYLIIDRDAEGNNTVHFLNQVDEEDLFALMEDDEVQKLQTELAEKEPEITVPEEETEPVKEEKEPNVLPAIATLALLIGGAAIYGFMKLKEKKKEEEAAKPDPDADYHDEIEYEFIDENELPDRDEEEDLEDEEEL